MNSEQIDSFLSEPRDAVLSVMLPSGRAIGTPIWFRWVGGVVRFQSPTTTAKTEALRRTRRASLCVHEQVVPVARFVTLEGPVREVAFDRDADIAAAADHYLGAGAATFMVGIDRALAAGRTWASFELSPETVVGLEQRLG